MSNPFISRLKKNMQTNFIVDFKSEVNDYDLGNLQNSIEFISDYMNKNQFLGGVAFISVNGLQLLNITRNSKISEDYETIHAITSNMQPEKFFKALPYKVTKNGLGHMEFEYFEIYFALISDEIAVSYFIIDEEFRLIPKLNKLNQQLTDYLDEETKQTEIKSEKENKEEVGRVPRAVPSPSPKPAKRKSKQDKVSTNQEDSSNEQKETKNTAMASVDNDETPTPTSTQQNIQNKQKEKSDDSKSDDPDEDPDLKSKLKNKLNEL